MGTPVMQPARHAAALVLRNAARAHTGVLMVLTLVRMVHRLAIVRRGAAGVCCLYCAVRPLRELLTERKVEALRRG